MWPDYAQPTIRAQIVGVCRHMIAPDPTNLKRTKLNVYAFSHHILFDKCWDSTAIQMYDATDKNLKTGQR